jgi:[FeFe] hydrogenase H-cluster maturation GTPase HydF
MIKTPKSLRLHIGIFGRRNVGKSSFLNAFVRQAVSIVSEIAGTTTDPVEKPMELLPIGPVLFIDTAGIDDIGSLGKERVAKTKKIFDRTDVAVIVAAEGRWGEFEKALVEEFKKRKIPIIAVFNKADLKNVNDSVIRELDSEKIGWVETISPQKKGMAEFRQRLISVLPDEFINNPSILRDLVKPGELAILVIPIDKEAPRGRIILPQVQAIRDILDNDSVCVVLKETRLRESFSKLKEKPAIVITDSQAFLKVAEDTPENIPMTSFSILFARLKGDLNEFVNGALAIKKLKSGDKILIAESCSHHPIVDDIGRVKIPKWLKQYTGCELEFVVYQGHDFPENLGDYKLVIQCGGCMTNRREILSRIERCRSLGVPITNYGVAIAYSLGKFERALKPFADSLDYFVKKGERYGE